MPNQESLSKPKYLRFIELFEVVRLAELFSDTAAAVSVVVVVMLVDEFNDDVLPSVEWAALLSDEEPAVPRYLHEV